MARQTIEVQGIKETLKQLNKLAPDLRREITKDYKRITKPMVSAAREAAPNDPPLSGMLRKWRRGGPWYGAQVDRKIKSKSIHAKHENETSTKASNTKPSALLCFNKMTHGAPSLTWLDAKTQATEQNKSASMVAESFNTTGTTR